MRVLDSLLKFPISVDISSEEILADLVYPEPQRPLEPRS
jgi:hypothetical protein